ncbi:MAG: hypothetical protein ACLFS5_04290 [Spirochaetaceae bacterium]
MKKSPVIADPRELFFAVVRRPSGTSGDEAFHERIREAFDTIYPLGAEALHIRYIPRGLWRRNGRPAICFASVEGHESVSVAWTSLVPLRIRLCRRAVVLRPWPDALGIACFARGIPVHLAVARRTEESDESAARLLAAVPRTFAAARRYLLIPRGPDRYSVGASRVADCGTGVRRIVERDRPSLQPALTGRPRAGPGTRSSLTVGLLVCALAVSLFVSGSSRDDAAAADRPTADAAAAAGVADGAGDEAALARDPTSGDTAEGPAAESVTPTPAAAGGLAAVARALHDAPAGLRLRQAGAADGQVRLTAVGASADETLDTLQESAEVAGVRLLSRRRTRRADGEPSEEFELLVEPRAEGAVRRNNRRAADAGKRARIRPVERVPEIGDFSEVTVEETEGDRAEAAFDGPAGTEYERSVRVRARGSPAAVAEAVSVLAEDGDGAVVTILALSREVGELWELDALVLEEGM